MVKLITDEAKDLEEEIERKYTFSHYEVCGKIPERLKKVLVNDNIHNLEVNESTRKFLLKLFRLKKDDVFLEIGTYYGFGTVKLSQKVKKVIAIEADKYNFKLTKTNVEANCDNVILVNKAVGEKKEKRMFYSREGETGQAKGLYKKPLKKVASSYEVDVDTIDNILIDLNIMNEITFCSLEINLGELSALKGAKKLLSRNNLRLLVAGLYYDDINELKIFLEEQNFIVYIGKKKKIYAFK